MHAPPEEYLPITHAWFAAELSQWWTRWGGCKQRGQTTTIWLKALLIHWQVGSSWFGEKLSPANRNKGYRGEQISRKIVSRELNARSYRDFAKNIALLGATFAKFAKSVGKKMGSNMRPQYIQFCDIHDRDISGLHCTTLHSNVVAHWLGTWMIPADGLPAKFLSHNGNHNNRNILHQNSWHQLVVSFPHENHSCGNVQYHHNLINHCYSDGTNLKRFRFGTERLLVKMSSGVISQVSRSRLAHREGSLKLTRLVHTLLAQPKHFAISAWFTL